jgi:hypothetical protein
MAALADASAACSSRIPPTAIESALKISPVSQCQRRLPPVDTARTAEAGRTATRGMLDAAGLTKRSARSGSIDLSGTGAGTGERQLDVRERALVRREVLQLPRKDD